MDIFLLIGIIAYWEYIVVQNALFLSVLEFVLFPPQLFSMGGSLLSYYGSTQKLTKQRKNSLEHYENSPNPKQTAIVENRKQGKFHTL